MTIRALELAGRYGWAVVSRDGSYVASGHRELRPSADRGEKAHQLANSIADLITEFSPEFIAIERPIVGPYGAVRNLYGYAMVVHMVAHIRELGFLELQRSSTYAAIVGNGGAKKVTAVEFARRYKPLCNSDDEADAVLVAFAAHKLRERQVKEAA